MKVIDQQFSEGRHSVILTEYLEWEEQKFKLVIKSDSYQFQSYASILRWDGNRWCTLYSIHYGDMTTPAGMIYPRNRTKIEMEPMQEDRKRLIEKAKAILSGQPRHSNG
jgi:hypothetical protein